jgi:AGCS family alanine or glycine:cation symporter
MYYLQAAFSRRYIPILCCLLMCVYATDVAQFSILLDSVNGYTTGQSRGLLATAMAVFLLLLAWRGVHKIASLSLLCMPPLLVIYVGCCLYVLAMHGRDFGPTLALVWKSAFEGYAPLGGFLGSSLLLTIQQGTTMAVYTGDIGLGFDASVQSESRIQHAPAQARLAILALASDMIICTLTCLVVLTTGVWTQLLEPSQYVGVAFNQLIPWGSYFVDLLLLISGFTSVTIYLAIGLKSSRFLHYHYGPLIFSLYSVMALIVFSFYSQVQLLSVMASCCGLLMICNVLGIWKLRHEIVFRE